MWVRLLHWVPVICRCSSIGRTSRCQREGCEFNPRHLLQRKRVCSSFFQPSNPATLVAMWFIASTVIKIKGNTHHCKSVYAVREERVRFSPPFHVTLKIKRGKPALCKFSSAGRAPPLQDGCREFKSLNLHHRFVDKY